MIDRNIEDSFEELIGEDAGYAVAYAVLQLAKATDRVADQIMALGLGNAATPMGALELLSSEVKRIAGAMEVIANREVEGG